MKSLYDDRLVAPGHLDRIVRMLDENQLNIAKAISGDQTVALKRMDTVDTNVREIDRLWGEYMATYLTAEEKQLAMQFAQARQKFVTDAMQPAVAAVKVFDNHQAIEIVHGPMEQLFQPVQQGINALIKLQLDVARSEFEDSQFWYRLVRNVCATAVTFGVLLGIVAGIWLVRAITRPLNAAVRIAGNIAAGDLTQRIDVESNNETGQLLRALKDMNDSLVNIVVQVRGGTETIATAAMQTQARQLAQAVGVFRLDGGNATAAGLIGQQSPVRPVPLSPSRLPHAVQAGPHAGVPATASNDWQEF